MAQSVDTKIVELKFNNDNFADKVDSTLTKLEQLNKDIKDIGFTEALKNLSKNAKKVDMSGITKGVEETTKSFSKMEIAGITAIANISNSVVNLGKKMIKSLVDPLTKGVIQGGLARAKNIEQATFQFEGLNVQRSDTSVSYYKEVMDAVEGTAYSYDIAAKAASQLATSNIGVTETTIKLADGSEKVAKVMNGQMRDSILAIAGVAAMSGQPFEQIADIFVNAAAKGAVMGDEFRRLTTSNINGMQIMADYYGKTVDDIQKMSKKGEISFNDFALAMREAFGDHAKDSTLIFEGALADVQAALARIGADFGKYYLNSARDIMNSTVPVIDAIRNKLKPAVSDTGSIMGKAAKSMSQYLDLLAYIIQRFPEGKGHMRDWVREHMNSWTNIADLYKRGDITEAIDGLNDWSLAIEGMTKEGIDGWQMLADYMDTDIKTIKKGVEEGTIGFNEFYKSFRKLWGMSDDLRKIEGIDKMFDKYIRKILAASGPTEDFVKQVDVIFAIFGGVKSLAGSLIDIFGSLASIFLTIAEHLAPLGTVLINVVQEIASFTVWLADAIATSEHFSSIIDSVISMILKLFEVMHLDKIAGAALMGITKAFDFLAEAIEKIQSGAAKVFSVVSKYFNILIDKIYTILTDLEALRQVAENLKKVGLVVALINLVNFITKPAQMFDALSSSIGSVSDSIVGMVKSVGKVFKEIAGLAGKIGAAIDEVTNTLKRMQEMIIATAVLEIAIAIGVLAGALYLLAKVPWSDLEKSGPAIASFITILGTLFAGAKFLGNLEETAKIWEKSVNDIKAIGLAMLEFAIAVAIMAGAIKVLSGIDQKQLYNAVGAVEILLVTLGALAKLLSPTTTKETGLKALWSGKKTTQSMTKGLLGLVAMAEAVNIVSKAIARIATIQDPESLKNALKAIEIVLITLTGIVKVLSGDKAAKMTKGVTTLIAMALAIRMLSAPIMELASIDGDSMWRGVGAVMGLMLALSMMTQMMSGAKGLIKVGVGVLLVAAAIKVLKDVVLAFASLDGDSLLKGIGSVIGLLFGLTMMLNMMDVKGLLVKAIGLVAIAYTLKELQDVVMTFGNNFDTALHGLLAIGIALTGLLFALYMFEAAPIGGILKLFGALMLGAVVVASFGAAIGIFGVGVAIFGVGLQSMAAGAAAASAVAGPLIAIMVGFAIAIGILASVGLPAIGVILALSLAFLLLGTGMEKMGRGMEDIALAIKLMSEMKGELGSLAFHITTFVKDLGKLKKEASKIGESFTEISTPLESMSKSIDEISKHIDDLVKAYEVLRTDTIASIQTLADSLTTLSQLNEQSFTQGTEAIKGFISELNGISTEATNVSNYAVEITTAIETLNTTVEDALKTFSLFQQRVRLFDAIGQSLNSIAEPIDKLNSLKDNLAGLSDDILGFVDTLKGMKDDTAVVEEAATQITDSLTKVGDAASLASAGFASFTENTAGILSKMGSGLESISKGVSKIVKVKDDIPAAGSAIQKFYKKLAKMSETADEVASGATKVSKALEKVGKAASKAITSKMMVSSGEKLIDGLIKGMNNKKTFVDTKAENIVSTAATKMKRKRKNYYDVGSYLIGGLIAGIRSQQDALEREVEILEAAAERAVKAKAEVSSPSKVWMRIGAFLGEGLAIGIKHSGAQVTRASVGLASVSEDAVSSAIGAISGAIETGWDIDPVITPVVDLSNVNRSASIVNSKFGSAAFSVKGSRLAGSISTLQNGRRDPLASTLSELNDRLGAVTDTMNSRQMVNNIQVDGAADPNAFADQLTRRLKMNVRSM